MNEKEIQEYNRSYDILIGAHRYVQPSDYIPDDERALSIAEVFRDLKNMVKPRKLLTE